MCCHNSCTLLPEQFSFEPSDQAGRVATVGAGVRRNLDVMLPPRYSPLGMRPGPGCIAQLKLAIQLGGGGAPLTVDCGRMSQLTSDCRFPACSRQQIPGCTHPESTTRSRQSGRVPGHTPGVSTQQSEHLSQVGGKSAFSSLAALQPLPGLASACPRSPHPASGAPVEYTGHVPHLPAWPGCRVELQVGCCGPRWDNRAGVERELRAQ